MSYNKIKNSFSVGKIIIIIERQNYSFIIKKSFLFYSNFLYKFEKKSASLNYEVTFNRWTPLFSFQFSLKPKRFSNAWRSIEIWESVRLIFHLFKMYSIFFIPSSGYAYIAEYFKYLYFSLKIERILKHIRLPH